MAEKVNYIDWVDRYVRNELSDTEEAEFEAALMDSPALQDELEAVLAIKQSLAEPDSKRLEQAPVVAEPTLRASAWQKYSIAAALALAVLNLGLFYKADNESAMWKARYENLDRSLGEVLNVPIDIMRSAETQQPDVTVQKPEGHALIVLEIETLASPQDVVQLNLLNDTEQLVRTWEARVRGDRRIVVAVTSTAVPTGRMWLEIQDSGESVDRRLIEFR